MKFPRIKSLDAPSKCISAPCHRCGGAGGSQHWPGFKCYRCGGDGKDPSARVWAYPASWSDEQCVEHYVEREERNARARAKRAAKLEAEVAAEQAQAELVAPGAGWLINEAQAELAEITQDEYRANRMEDMVFRFLDLRNKTKFGLSEKQIEFMNSLISSARALISKTAAEIEAKQQLAPLEEGRREITGQIVSFKEYHSQFGLTVKQLILLPDGNKVFGTVPSKQEAEKGETVTLTATITRSPSDPNFGFYSRPTMKG